MIYCWLLAGTEIVDDDWSHGVCGWQRLLGAARWVGGLQTNVEAWHQPHQTFSARCAHTRHATASSFHTSVCSFCWKFALGRHQRGKRDGLADVSLTGLLSGNCWVFLLFPAQNGNTPPCFISGLVRCHSLHFLNFRWKFSIFGPIRGTSWIYCIQVQLVSEYCKCPLFVGNPLLSVSLRLFQFSLSNGLFLLWCVVICIITADQVCIFSICVFITPFLYGL